MKNNFNKEYFSKLLKRAIGSNTLREFSKNTGVSAGYLSRFTACSIENPPSPEVIKKISSKSVGRVGYRELMEAAGYISKDKSEEEITYNLKIINEIKEKEKKIELLIMKYLYELNDEIIIKKKNFNYFIPDIYIEIPKNSYKNWYFDIKVYTKNSVNYSNFFKEYGKATILDLKKDEIFVSATNIIELYDLMKKNPPKSLRANYMIMLVDLEKENIIQQEIISKYKD